MKKILVTGDRGYIGSVLVPKLIKEGYNVTGLDTGYFEDNLAFPIRDPGYLKIKKDIRDISENDIEGFDGIVHLSALSNDPMGEIDPKLTEEINYKSSVKLAKIAKKVGVKKFIFSSSCSIYGIARNGIVDESSKVNPLTSYAKSKIMTELALNKLADENFFVGLMRNSTVYGFSPRFRNDLVVNNLVTTALAFGEIRIMSDGTPWRPLIDVRDLSDVFIKFIKTRKKNLNGKVINVGFKENNLQVRHLVDAVKKQLPECKVVYTGEHGSDARSYKVRFDEFERNFPGIKQKWNLASSVQDMIIRLNNTKFNKNVFESGRYTRLSVLKKLREEGIIDKGLYWRS